MTVIFSHETSLNYLRSSAFEGARRTLTAVPVPRDCTTSLAEVREAARISSLGAPPFHFLALNEKCRLRGTEAICHFSDLDFRPRSFLRILPDIYVSSPELCFLQLAQELSIVQLAEIGFEFCGSYALDVHDLRGFHSREPLTSVRKLNRYVSEMPGAKGRKKARRAVRFVANNAASPMETKLAMLLCLPSSLGGFALPFPKLNHPIDIDKRASYEGMHRYVCDLYWPRGRIALEYDSDMFHTGPERIANDAERRRHLAAKGLTVISVTKDHVLDANKTEALAKLAATKLGRRIRTKRADATARRLALRKELLRWQP